MRAMVGILMAVTVWGALARGQTTQSTDDAALVYREALEALPGEDPADPNSSIYNIPPLKEEAVHWVGDCATSLALLHRAAGMAKCNWNYDYLASGSISPADLTAVRKLSTAAHYKALQLDAENRVAESMALRLDQMALAYQFGSEAASPCRLVGYGIGENAVVWAAHDFNRAAAEDLGKLNAAIDRLRKLAAIGDVIKMEKQASANIRRAEAKRLMAERKVLPGAAQKVEASIREMETFCDKAAELATLTPGEFDKAMGKLLGGVKADDPRMALAGLFSEVRKTSARNEEVLLMGKAAIAITQTGRTQLSNFKDPLNNGAQFRFRQLYTGGFELSCNYSANGAFLTLTANDTKAAATTRP